MARRSRPETASFPANKAAATNVITSFDPMLLRGLEAYGGNEPPEVTKAGDAPHRLRRGRLEPLVWTTWPPTNVQQRGDGGSHRPVE